MANAPRGGRRLAGNRPAQNDSNPTAGTSSQFQYTNSSSNVRVDDAVIDEILRSIAGVEFNTTSAPNRTLQEPPRRSALQQPRSRINPNQNVQQPSAEPPAGDSDSSRHATIVFPKMEESENEYQAAATHFAQQQTKEEQDGENSGEEIRTGFNLSQSQSFQPARPAQRDTDRMPTIVDDEPKRQHPVLNRILTLVVVILIVVALVLGVKMVYIFGPSLGWDLPDLSHVPVVSNVLGMIPDASEDPIQMPEDDTAAEQAQTQMPDPTSVTLDADSLTLHEGEKKVLTATLDVENWGGLLAWASSDKNQQVIKLDVLGPNTAQVEYVGPGSCAVAVQVGVKPADGSDAPYATCHIDCVANEVQEEAEGTDGETENTDGETEQTGETDTAEQTGGHVEISLNREDFTLNVGERHQLMRDNADQVTWTSSNEEVATVANGIVTAVGAGSATITATGPDGATASAICRVR